MIIKLKKILAILFISLFLIIGIFYGLWLLLPNIIEHPKTISWLTKYAKQTYNVDLVIENPSLKTTTSLMLYFNLKKIYVQKNNNKLLNIEDLKTNISIKNILSKRIIVKRFSVETCYADINKICALFPQKEQKSTAKFDWDIDVFDALLYARNVDIIYNLNGTNIHLLAKGFGTNNARKVNRRVYFKTLLTVTRNNQTIKIGLWDQKKVFIDNQTLYINDLPIIINGSKVYIKAIANRKIKYNLSVYSDSFKAHNIEQVLNSNLIIPNGKELLGTVAKDINGAFSFNVNFTPKIMNIIVNLKNVTLKLIPIKNLPITLSTGTISIDNRNIKLNKLTGYYCNSKINAIDFDGTIDDYMKSMTMNITGNAVVTDILMRNYISTLAQCPISVLGKADTRIVIKSKYNKFDILWLFKLMPKNDILVDGASISSVNRERVLAANMCFENMLLKIKSIDYFLTHEKDGKILHSQILKIFGNIDCKSAKLLDVGIEIPNPLRSEFFNVFFEPGFFKKGTVVGKIHYINNGKYPKLDADMIAENVRIPSQRLKIKRARIISDKKGRVHVVSKGRFKRSDYKVGGNINNNLTLPLVVNNIELTIDNLNIERVLHSMNNQNSETVEEQTKKISESDEDDEDDLYTFSTGLLLINDCNLHLLNANYKNITMGNLHANLTLDKDGLLKVKSNKFDFAEGISTLKVECDLIKHKYYVRLGIKDVNSDLIASDLLNLKKEISGKAKGLIELNTDDTLKMNGKILFAIDNGSIAKVGLLEYVLKFVALFRNPLAMISPSTFVDLVNIPEGNFDKISGELYIKNNIVEKMMIKSKASQLSSFIIGRLDLESRDSTLRVYTKMSNRKKGLAGILRNISLNALANRLPLGNKNDINYYSMEIKQLPEIDAPEKDCQIFLTKIDGDVEHNNFISSLRRIK